MSEHYYCPRCNKEYDEDDKKLVCSECGYELAADQLDKNMTKLIYKYYNAAMPGKTSSNTAATANSATTKKSSNTKNASASAASNTASKTASSSANSYTNQNKTTTQTTSSSYSSSSGPWKELIIVTFYIIGICAFCTVYAWYLKVKKSKANDITAVIQQVETETQETEKTQKKQPEQTEIKQTEATQQKQQTKANKTENMVGTIGEGGGVIFYDKGEYSDGWRYLEVAMEDVGPVSWGKIDGRIAGYENFFSKSGYTGTYSLISRLGSNNPAYAAASYGNSEDHWYLGNGFEMKILYNVLYANKIDKSFTWSTKRRISKNRKILKKRIGNIEGFVLPQKGFDYWVVPSGSSYKDFSEGYFYLEVFDFERCKFKTIQKYSYEKSEDSPDKFLLSYRVNFVDSKLYPVYIDNNEAYVRPIRRY